MTLQYETPGGNKRKSENILFLHETFMDAKKEDYLHIYVFSYHLVFSCDVWLGLQSIRTFNNITPVSQLDIMNCNKGWWLSSI